jgi:hypothetical protein
MFLFSSDHLLLFRPHSSPLHQVLHLHLFRLSLFLLPFTFTSILLFASLCLFYYYCIFLPVSWTVTDINTVKILTYTNPCLYCLEPQNMHDLRHAWRTILQDKQTYLHCPPPRAATLSVCNTTPTPNNATRLGVPFPPLQAAHSPRIIPYYSLVSN